LKNRAVSKIWCTDVDERVECFGIGFSKIMGDERSPEYRGIRRAQNISIPLGEILLFYLGIDQHAKQLTLSLRRTAKSQLGAAVPGPPPFLGRG